MQLSCYPRVFDFTTGEISDRIHHREKLKKTHGECDGIMAEEALHGFKVGSKVMYPSHGLGIIQRIEERSVAGSSEPCYVIRFPDSGMTIMAPVKAAGIVGLRKLICKNDIGKIIGILSTAEKLENIEPNWNKRQKLYIEKIKSGSIFEVASVYRDLYALRTSKGLSFGEQQVFDNAYKLIVSELAEAKGVQVAKVDAMIKEAMSN